MIDTRINEVAQYCASHIEDYPEKVALALSDMGRRMPIDYAFRNEIEERACEWAEDNGYAIDFFEGIDVEEIIFNS